MNELVRIDFGRCFTITTVSTNASGSFTTVFTVDTQPYGATTVRATGLTSGKTADAIFRILPSIVMVQPTRGTVGSMVTITGNGYGATEEVMIAFGTRVSITQSMTSETGNFATTFTVDTQPYGTTTISAFGLNSMVAAYNTFRIYPNIIFLSPTCGSVGSFVTLAGNGFGASEGIRINFGTTTNITQISSSANGYFTAVFTIDTQPYGYTTIAAVGINSNANAYATFVIMPNVIMLTPSWGTVGAIVIVRGNGFGASEGVRIEFGTTRTILLTLTSAYGSWTTVFTVDTQPFGTTTIRAVGLGSGAEAQNRFFIVPNIVLLTPNIGTVGSFVTIAGNGFGQAENIRVDFGTTLNIGGVISSTSGTFSALFTVDTQPYGITTIVARGLVTGSVVLAQFTIVPKIVISPTAGQIGSKITVAGNGFGATELIRIAFGNTPTITFTTTTGSGGFQTVFTVNSQPMGTTTIAAYGVMTNTYACGYFVILPATILKITPAVGNIAVGSTFTAQIEIVDVKQLTTAGTYLSFNPNVLEVLEVNQGAFPPGGAVINKEFNEGQINYSVGLYPYPASATGSGILCTIKFRAKAGGTSSVVFDSDIPHNRNTILINVNSQEIPYTKQEAIYQVITGIEIEPKGTETFAGKTIVYTCLATCGSLQLDVTGSTTFTSNGGGSWTANSFLAKYIGTYTIQGMYLGFVGTTSVIITPGTPTTLGSVSGNGQVGTCTFPLKDPFIVKVTDTYGNPCNGIGVNWQIISYPSTATGQSIFPTNTTTNILGIASSSLTLGTEPPGTYTIHAISSGLAGSPCTFTARSLRRFGNIAGFCLLNLGTVTLGATTTADIQVKILLGTTTIAEGTTNVNSYFIFQNIPVGTYTLTFDTWGASPGTKTNVCISPTQVENTTYIGTMTLLAGDVNNDTQVNTGDWDGFVTAFGEQEGNPNWQQNKEGDFNHNTQVNEWDFMVFSNNFGQQQPMGMPKLIPRLTKAKAKKTTTSEAIKLSFNLKSNEGVNLDDLRVGDIIDLEINISEAKKYLGGEIHLSFNPQVLRVVEIQPGNFPQLPGTLSPVLMNKANNTTGKIDYAVVSWKPEEESGGLFATVRFMVIACGNSSEIGFNFDTEENRETMFVEKHNPEEKAEEVIVDSPEVLIIKVPLLLNDFESTFVYPNPVHKEGVVTFAKVPASKPIKLRIFNIAGELVYEDWKNSNSSNEIPNAWDLRNKDNEYVASGIYIYLLEYQGLTKKGKIGVIK